MARALNVTPEWLAEGRLPKRIISISGETEPLVPKFSAEITLLKKTDDYCEIPQFDTGGAMGVAALVLQDQPGVIQSWKVSPEWLRKNVKGYNSAKSLCIVTGFGDSMRPLFNPGDPLLVDISVNTVDFELQHTFSESGTRDLSSDSSEFLEKACECYPRTGTTTSLGRSRKTWISRCLAAS